MKRVLIIAVTIVAVVALGNVMFASAQGVQPPVGQNATCPLGYTCPYTGTAAYGGMMGGRGGMMGGYGTYTGTMPYGGMMGRGGMAAMRGANGLHEQVWTAIAAELGLTYAELNTATQNGQTVAQLAEATGVSLDELKAVATAAHRAALDDLVEQGVMTQAQADAMADHMDDMPMFNFEQGYGPGMMQGRGMMHGRGMMGGGRGYQPPAGPQG